MKQQNCKPVQIESINLKMTKFMAHENRKVENIVEKESKLKHFQSTKLIGPNK